MKFIGVRAGKQFAIVGPTTAQVMDIAELPDLLHHYRTETSRLVKVGASEVALSVYRDRLAALEEIATQNAECSATTRADYGST